MESFCRWAKGQNPVDDSNPDHFDHAALISRYRYTLFNGLETLFRLFHIYDLDILTK